MHFSWLLVMHFWRDCCILPAVNEGYSQWWIGRGLALYITYVNLQMHWLHFRQWIQHIIGYMQSLIMLVNRSPPNLIWLRSAQRWYFPTVHILQLVCANQFPAGLCTVESLKHICRSCFWPRFWLKMSHCAGLIYCSKWESRRNGVRSTLPIYN